jgi:hypothetical protein
MKTCGGVDVQFHAVISLALEGGELLAPYPGCFTGERTPSTHSIGGLVGSRVSQDTLVKKNLCPLLKNELNFLECLAHNLVTILNQLSQLHSGRGKFHIQKT